MATINGTIVNGCTIIAQPLSSGAYAGQFQLQRADGTTFYDYLNAYSGNGPQNQVSPTINGFDVNDSNPFPVKVVASVAQSSGSGSSSPATAIHYEAITASGTDYSVGDVVALMEIVTPGSPATVTQVWVNMTANKVLSTAPNLTNFIARNKAIMPANLYVGGALASTSNPVPMSAQSLPLPANAATDATVATVTTALGTDGTSPPTLPNGSTGVRGWLRYLGSLLSGNLNVIFPSAQPISAAALPLPANAATDATVGGVTTALGTDGTSPPTLPGGATGVRGWLRYLGSLLSGTLTVAFASAQAITGTVTANVVGGNATAVKTDSSATTQPISAAALPLPTGAAQDGTDVTGVSQLTGGAGIRGWLSGIYSRLSTYLGANLFVGGTVASATNPVPTSLANAAATTGAIGSNGAAVSVQLPALANGVTYSISGTFAETLQLQSSFDGTTWTNIVDIQGVGSSTTARASTVYLSGATYFRIVSTAYTSGSAAISLQPISCEIGIDLILAGQPVGVTNALPVAGSRNARTDYSGTITTASTAQTVIAAGLIAHGFYFFNPSTSDMWIRDDGTAASAGGGSILVKANGGYYESPPSMGAPTSLISVFCATAAAAFTCKAA